MTMHVSNDQPCTLSIGGVTIGGGESKSIPAEWEPRCIELAKVGALRVIDGDGPVQRPAKSRAESLLAAMSEDDRAELLAKFGKPEVKADPKHGMPEDFGSWHVNRAKAWVTKCSDTDVLNALSKAETRETVLTALMERLQHVIKEQADAMDDRPASAKTGT